MSHTPAAPEASTTFEYSRAEYLEGMAAVYNHLVPGGFPVGLGLVGAAIQGLAGYMGGLVGPDLTFSIVLYGTLWAATAWVAVRAFAWLGWSLYRRKPERERSVVLSRRGSGLAIDGLGRVIEVADDQIVDTLSAVSVLRLRGRRLHFVPNRALEAVSRDETDQRAPLLETERTEGRDDRV